MKNIIQFIKANISAVRWSALFVLFAWFLVSQIQVAPGFLASLFLILGLVLLGLDLAFEWKTIYDFFRGKNAKKGLRIWTQMVLLAFILGFLYFLFNRQLILRADLTANQRYSLSEQTLLALKNLSEPVKYYIFKMEVPQSGNPMMARQIAELQQHVSGIEFVLQDFARKNSQVSHETVDMQEDPGLVKQYAVREPFTIVAVAGGGKTRFIRPEDYLSQQYVGGRPQIIPQYEEALTTALRSLVRQKTWKIVFTSGHQEKDPYDDAQTGAGLLRESLEKEGFTVVATNLIMAGGVPADCDLLVMAGPRDDFAQIEVDYVDQYLMQGKPAFFMAERDAGKRYRELVSRWGADIGTTTLFDPTRHVGQGVIVPDIEPHRITKGLSESKRQVFLAMATPLTRSVFANNRTDTNGNKFSPYVVYPLLKSTSRAWAETDPSVAEYNAGEERGPFEAALAITLWPAKTEEKDGKKTVTAGPAKELNIAIFGDSDFIVSGYLGQFPGNRDLFVNTANWAIGQEDRITIPPKTMKSYPLNLTVGERNFIGWFSLLVLPLAVIVIGIIVYVRRRKYGKA
jgi:ABC-type uncharacterized transport system involved in gliding motility auxiliary subunit